MAVGRFAPSPTGDLHLGNLRTAVLAWLFARSSGSAFLVRMEDLDHERVRGQFYATQLDDLRLLGLDWDGDVVRQSDRLDRYADALADLERRGVTYPCYCTRREIREAASAPNRGPRGADPSDPTSPDAWTSDASVASDTAPASDGSAASGAIGLPGRPDGAYPGTCRDLTAAERHDRERAGRPPALRVRGHDQLVRFVDRQCGPVTGWVDDVVVRRNDGTPAYNLAVVVDDVAQGIEEVVRGDDLLSSTPRQIALAHLLDLEPPTYAHVPLVLAPDGDRLAKRHGAVTIADRSRRGIAPAGVLGELLASLGLTPTGEPVGPGALRAVAGCFDPSGLPREPWRIPADVV